MTRATISKENNDGAQSHTRHDQGGTVRSELAEDTKAGEPLSSQSVQRVREPLWSLVGWAGGVAEEDAEDRRQGDVTLGMESPQQKTQQRNRLEREGSFCGDAPQAVENEGQDFERELGHSRSPRVSPDGDFHVGRQGQRLGGGRRGRLRRSLARVGQRALDLCLEGGTKSA